MHFSSPHGEKNYLDKSFGTLQHNYPFIRLDKNSGRIVHRLVDVQWCKAGLKLFFFLGETYVRASAYVERLFSQTKQFQNPFHEKNGIGLEAGTTYLHCLCNSECCDLLLQLHLLSWNGSATPHINEGISVGGLTRFQNMSWKNPCAKLAHSYTAVKPLKNRGSCPSTISD